MDLFFVSRARVQERPGLFGRVGEEAVRRLDFTPGEARRDADIDDLRRQLAASKREITELNRQLTAAATVIASLHHDNQLLRTEHHAGGSLVPLPLPGHSKEPTS